jgi:hypothetical protein
VSLKSLLSHHPSGCQPVRPVGPTGPTPVAALSGGPTGPMAGDAARPGPMSRALPPHCATRWKYFFSNLHKSTDASFSSCSITSLLISLAHNCL